MRRDLVHALAEAREARVQELLVDDALEAEVAPEPAVLLRHVGAQQPGLPRALPELGVDVTPRLPGLVVGQDLTLDPGPRGLAEELVLVARPGRAGPLGACRGHARIIAALGRHRAKWHSPRVPFGRPVESSRPMPIRSPHPDVHVPDVPLTDFVLADAAARGDRPAIVDAVSGATLTYAQLAEDVDRCAAGLAARGLAPGEVVGIYAPNVPEYAVAFHGVARAGGTNTTINGLYTAAEAALQLRMAGARYPRDRSGAGRASSRGGAHGRRRGGLHVRRGRRHDTVRGPARSAGNAGAEAGDRARPPRRRAAVLERHDRAPQGRHAHAPQPRGEPLPVRARATHRRVGRRDRGAPVLPHLRADARAQRRPAARRAHRHDAALRPRAIPRGDRAARDHGLLRRTADRARARQAPARRSARPLEPALRHERRRAARLPTCRVRRSGAWAAASSRATD